MRIARFSIDGNVAFGAVEGEKQDELVLDIIKGIPFADFELSGTKVPVSKVRLLPPVLPNKVVAVGRNYADHAKELGNEVPEAPFAFFKPATSVIGPGDEIQYPSFSQDVHHEADGHRMRSLSREDVEPTGPAWISLASTPPDGKSTGDSAGRANVWTCSRVSGQMKRLAYRARAPW